VEGLTTFGNERRRRRIFSIFSSIDASANTETGLFLGKDAIWRRWPAALKKCRPVKMWMLFEMGLGGLIPIWKVRGIAGDSGFGSLLHNAESKARRTQGWNCRMTGRLPC